MQKIRKIKKMVKLVEKDKALLDKAKTFFYGKLCKICRDRVLKGLAKGKPFNPGDLCVACAINYDQEIIERT